MALPKSKLKKMLASGNIPPISGGETDDDLPQRRLRLFGAQVADLAHLLETKRGGEKAAVQLFQDVNDLLEQISGSQKVRIVKLEDDLSISFLMMWARIELNPANSYTFLA